MKKENKTIKKMETYTKPVVGIHKFMAEKGFTVSLNGPTGNFETGDGGEPVD